MNSSLFDLFKQHLYQSYPYLNNYDVCFKHIGDDELRLDFFLFVTHNDPYDCNIEELGLINKNVKNFAKLFQINIFTLSDFSMSATI